MLLLFWHPYNVDEVPLPNDDLVTYDWNITETEDPSLSGVYVIPPIVMSNEDT